MPDPAAKYISLETFRRDGTGVRTPVWFVVSDGAVYVLTGAQSGKVKRMRANPSVRMAECSLRGDVRGGWEEGTAELVSGGEIARVSRMRRSKYGLLGAVVGAAVGMKKTVVCRITPRGPT